MSTLKTNRIEPVGSTAGTVTVDGTMVFTQGATFPGGISVGQAAYFSTGVTVAGGISVSGNATFGGTVFMGSSAAPFYGPTGNAPLYACRGFASVVLTNTSGADTSSSGNIVSQNGNNITVSQVSTGYYKCDFSTAMPNANYAVVASTGEDQVGRKLWSLPHTTNGDARIAATTTTFYILFCSSDGVNRNPRDFSVAVFA